MTFSNLYVEMKGHFITFNFFIILVLKYSWCETCVAQNSCHCRFSNGTSIDLSSLGYHDKARWESMKPLKNENYSYFYNPCYSFSVGPSNKACAKGVAVCQVNISKGLYYDCGDPDKVKFNVDAATGKLQLIYTAAERSTTVTLECSQDAIEPKLEVIGEILPQTGKYAMTLTSKCACPDMCHSSHLSAGSVLVIIFMIFVSLYLVLGIIYSSLTRGAHGWELIPHYEFWADFPLLVRDGCVFVVSGCKTETAYERI